MPDSPRIPRRAPPWWPADEEWPPKGTDSHPGWRHRRRFFVVFVGLLFATILLVGVGLFTAVSWLITVILRTETATRPLQLVEQILFLLLLGTIVVLISFTLRTIRRSVVPISDLLDAASRIESGDYTVRVIERGPRVVRSLTRAFNKMATQLESHETQRRNLLADITHELRTPLTIIQGNLEGLIDGIYARDDAHLTLILEETRVFGRLVDDLRTLAQAESGILSLVRENTDMAELITETINALKPQARLRDVTLHVVLDSEMPLIRVDPIRIRTVLTNLLTNSLRYAQPGTEITIASAVDADRKSLQVSVTDVGQGIPEDVLPHIFERFYKSSDSNGSGLGLSISKYIVEAHGGQIIAQSTPGCGSTFTITIPLQPG